MKFPSLDRRKFLAGFAAAATAIAFDPFSKTWVAGAHAAGAIEIPGLDGQLVFDATSLGEAAEDFGHIIHRSPTAVLKPGSIRDIVKVVKFANEHGIKVAMRGQGHCRYGQAQVQDGIVIDSRSLTTIHRISANSAKVDPGVCWGDLVSAAFPAGLTPPVLNDFWGLTICGMLAIGGFGGSSHRHGLQVDNVLELEVVTGCGELITCSPTRCRELFNSALGGLGQFAIIVSATVKLIPAPARVRWFRLSYTDRAAFMNDQRAAMADQRFHHLAGSASLQASGWVYTLDAASFYTSPAPDNAKLIGDLTGNPTIADLEYVAWTNRNAAGVAAQKQSGVWYWKHPWIHVFVPDSEADEFVSSVLGSLTPAKTGGGPVLIFPFDTTKFTRPFVAAPSEDVAYVFAILRATPDAQIAADMVADNRTVYEYARDIGGKKYPIDAVPSTPADWEDHYGDRWSLFRARKLQYDPQNVLTPGQGIFAPLSSG